MRSLDGITVVTLEYAIAAPFCTRRTAPVARYKNCLRWGRFIVPPRLNGPSPDAWEPRRCVPDHGDHCVGKRGCPPAYRV